MTTLLRGTALRYVRTFTLTRNGPMTVAELVAEVARAHPGNVCRGPPRKAN